MSRRHISLILSAVFTWVAALPAAAAQSPLTEQASEKPRVQRLDVLVTTWLRRPELAHSMVGLEIMDLPSGRTLFNFNANKRFVPASVAKVFTTACALDTLGADFRYQTRLLAYGPAKKDKVAGDLVLEPSQDPSLALEDLRRMFLTVKKNGIRHIDGNLHLMRVEGGYDYFSPAWLLEDWGQHWMPVSSNLVLDSNLASVSDPGKGLPVLVEPFERLDNAMWRSLLLSGVTSGWVTFDSRINRARLFRSPLPELGAGATIMVGNPEEYNLAVAQLAARASGLKIGAKPARYAPREEALVLAQHSSKPLKDLIELTLRESDNLYAQQLLRTLGLKARQTHKNVPLEESGLEFLRRWLVALGVPPHEVVLFDGCGLSRKNCVTPHALNMVLRHMAGPKVNGLFLGLLRFEGTSRSRPGSFEFKTGAMDTVRAVTGVLRTAGNHTMAVSIMVNGHRVSVSDVRVAFGSLTSQLRHLSAAGVPVAPAAHQIRKVGRSPPPGRRVRKPGKPATGRAMVTDRQTTRRRQRESHQAARNIILKRR